jgi:hypothetical protein
LTVTEALPIGLLPAKVIPPSATIVMLLAGKIMSPLARENEPLLQV